VGLTLTGIIGNVVGFMHNAAEGDTREQYTARGVKDWKHRN